MANYFQCAIDPATRNFVIGEALRHLRPKRPDTIVCRGVSGQAVGAILAYELGCNLYVVRKEGEASHACSKSSGKLGENAWIVDDFIASGQTMEEIFKVTGKSAIQGIYLYNHGQFGYSSYYESAGIRVIKGDTISPCQPIRRSE